MRRRRLRGTRGVRAFVWTVAASVALGSVAYYGWTGRDRGVRAEPRGAGETERTAEFTVDPLLVSAIPPPRWRWEERLTDPGSDASRDLLSPPECWRDPAGRWVRGRRPSAVAAGPGSGETKPPTEGVQVLGIVRRSFPWQLVGFAGDGPEPVGLFEDVASGELVWRRSGGSLGDGAFRIVSLTVRLSAAEPEVAGAAPVREAQAVLRERATSAVHELCTAERRGLGLPRVELQLSAHGPVHLVSAGERVVADGAMVEVAEVDVSARRVVVRASGHPEPSPLLTAERVPVRWHLARVGETENP